MSKFIRSDNGSEFKAKNLRKWFLDIGGVLYTIRTKKGVNVLESSRGEQTYSATSKKAKNCLSTKIMGRPSVKRLLWGSSLRS